jgi:8-oxo-dGTP pyrophosphatase MutT (NUDIX family)
VNAAQAERLRETLLDPAEASAIALAGEKAAALVALHELDGELCAVFTRRREHLARHAGQISLPGGRADPGDADLLATALREADEEIGLRPGAVTVLGALPPVSVRASGFALYPFIGAIERPERWTAAQGEVDAILELSLAGLAASYAVREIERAGRLIVTPTFDAAGELMWGATARIVADLLARIGLLGA